MPLVLASSPAFATSNELEINEEKKKRKKREKERKKMNEKLERERERERERGNAKSGWERESNEKRIRMNEATKKGRP